MRVAFAAMSAAAEKDAFDPTVDVVWFRDVGLYRVKAIPTPIGFLSFRQMLLIGVGALLSLVGVEASWGIAGLQLLSLAPLGVMVWLSTKRVGMVSPEAQLLVYLTGGRAERAEEEERAREEKREERVLEVSATETRPGPFTVYYTGKVVAGRPRDAILFVDGQERGRASPMRVGGNVAHYKIFCMMEASEAGVHNAEVRLDGTDEGVERFRLLVKAGGVEIGQ